MKSALFDSLTAGLSAVQFRLGGLGGLGLVLRVDRGEVVVDQEGDHHGGCAEDDERDVPRQAEREGEVAGTDEAERDAHGHAAVDQGGGDSAPFVGDVAGGDAVDRAVEGSLADSGEGAHQQEDHEAGGEAAEDGADAEDHVAGDHHLDAADPVREVAGGDLHQGVGQEEHGGHQAELALVQSPLFLDDAHHGGEDVAVRVHEDPAQGEQDGDGDRAGALAADGQQPTAGGGRGGTRPRRHDAGGGRLFCGGNVQGMLLEALG